MRILYYFIFFTLIGCSSGSEQKKNVEDTARFVTKIDSTETHDENIDFRKEFISLYKNPILIDTLFVSDSKKYKVVFKHYCIFDSSLVIPAKYNFDAHTDFITHHFASDLAVIAGKDTVFKKHITEKIFSSLLDTPLLKYATLLYPTLSLKNDSILIHYSISIPVTDVGIGANIQFDEKGNYVIRK